MRGLDQNPYIGKNSKKRLDESLLYQRNDSL